MTIVAVGGCYLMNIWVPQDDGQIARLALEAVRARQRAAVGDKDKMRWAIGGESRARQNNLLALAENIKPIKTRASAGIRTRGCSAR